MIGNSNGTVGLYYVTNPGAGTTGAGTPGAHELFQSYSPTMVHIVNLVYAVVPAFDEPANRWCAVAAPCVRFPAEPELRRVLVAPDQAVTDGAAEHARGLPWWRTLRGARRQRYRRASAQAGTICGSV